MDGGSPLELGGKDGSQGEHPGQHRAAQGCPRQDPPGRNRQKSLKIFLPLAAQSRYHCAWKMAYFSTEPASERRNVTGKNRVWDFFRLSNETHPANRRRPAQPRRKIDPTPMKTASGIPYWPSRDPIGERGGKNLYAFDSNSTISRWDYLGLLGPVGGGESASEGGKSDACSHIIREMHFLGKGEAKGNYDHYNNISNDGGTCYIGCGMNYLNRLQGLSHEANAAGVKPIPNAEYDENGIMTTPGVNQESIEKGSDLGKQLPEGFVGPDIIDTISEPEITWIINQKIDEIVSEKCAKCTPFREISITIICPHLGATDHRCGQTIKRPCF